MHSATDRETPPLSPVLLAGLALRPLPAAPLGPLLRLAMSALRRRHPEIFDRLADLGDACFVIDPVDLPFCFVLRPGAGAPRIHAIKEATQAEHVTAVIRGPLLALIDLLEGRVDGDALFFSRDLTIEGDTEAVLTLRNAVDSGEIKVVDDLLSVVAPLDRPLRLAWNLAEAVFERAARDLETLRGATVAPLEARCARQAAELRELEAQVAELRRRTRRGKPTGGGAP